MLLLALETSCDETAAAVIQDGRVLSSVVSSQIGLHAEYGGVVPELATREHLRNLLPVSRTALHEAGKERGALDALAATLGPGLPGALLIGSKAAQALSYALRRPFFGIHHHEAHLYSPWIEGKPLQVRFDLFQPNISLIVSGGHTLLVRVRAPLEHEVLGGAIDDAAGECFDKTAKLMGLPYPGGPELDRLASQGNPKAFPFPRPMLNDPNFDFSFSGLKTAVRYHLRDHPALLQDPIGVRNLCASVQEAIVEVLVAKTIRAAKTSHYTCITASGGVTCNRRLRQSLEKACQEQGFHLRLADRSLCTDNAAMVGILAEEKARRGCPPTPLDSDPQPAWGL